MEKPLRDILQWFAYNPTFQLEGWYFWDYVKVDVFIGSLLNIIISLLLYDRGEAGNVLPQKKSEDTAIIAILISVSIFIALYIGIAYALYEFLGLFITNTPYRVLIIAILYTFLQKGASGSAITRAFLKGLPNMYITICILQALGFWFSFGWIAITIIINIPELILTHYDD